MSYVDAFYDRGEDTIRVVERKDGKRVFHEYNPDTYFISQTKEVSIKVFTGNHCRE